MLENHYSLSLLDSLKSYYEGEKERGKLEAGNGMHFAFRLYVSSFVYSNFGKNMHRTLATKFEIATQFEVEWVLQFVMENTCLFCSKFTMCMS